MPILVQLLILFGIINIIFIPLSFYICWNKGGRFSFYQYPLSYASKTPIKTFYSLALILIALFQALFISGLFIIFPSTQSALIILLFFSGMLSLTLSGIVTSRIHQNLHRFFTVYMIVSITLWAFIFSSSFLISAPTVGYIGNIIGLIALLGVPLLYFKTKAFGLSEILFALLTVAWNMLFIVYLSLVSFNLN